MWAIAQNHRAANPADRKVIVGALGKTNGGSNFAALHHSKVAGALAVIGSSAAHPSTIAAARFLTLTATRSGETRLATWDEIDLATQTWNLSDGRTKTGKPHRVPLSGAAMKVLAEAAARTGGEGLIFPSATGRAMSDSTISKLFKENNVGCVPHGMAILVSGLVRRNRDPPRGSRTSPRSRRAGRGRRLCPVGSVGTPPGRYGSMGQIPQHFILPGYYPITRP